MCYIVYFDRWAEGWYELKNHEFKSEDEAERFVRDNHYKLGKEFSRAVKDGDYQIIKKV